MHMDLEVQGNKLVARLEGELDLGVADKLRDTLDNALTEQSLTFLILNLSEVSFVDSSGLGVILGRYKKLAVRGGKVFIVGAKPQVKRILELSGILRIIQEFALEEEVHAKIG